MKTIIISLVILLLIGCENSISVPVEYKNDQTMELNLYMGNTYSDTTFVSIGSFDNVKFTMPEFIRFENKNLTISKNDTVYIFWTPIIQSIDIYINNELMIRNSIQHTPFDTVNILISHSN